MSSLTVPHRRFRTGIRLVILLGVLAVVSWAPTASALCRPTTAQASVSPGLPESTVSFFCGDFCRGDWKGGGFPGGAELNVTNDFDSHYLRCNLGAPCVWDAEHHLHTNSVLTSRLKVGGEGFESSIVWWPC